MPTATPCPTATPALGWRDQYRELWARLGALALSDDPPPLDQIVDEVRQLLCDHALVQARLNVSRAAERLSTGRAQVRRARGWLLRLTDARRLLNAQPVAVWRCASVRQGEDGQAQILVPTEAQVLVAAGPLRVTVEPISL